MDDSATMTSKDYQDQLVQVIKALQQKSHTEEESLSVGQRLSSLMSTNPLHCFQELFKLWMKNASSVEIFTNVFKHCRPCFQIKTANLASNEKEEEEGSEEQLCVISVLKRMALELLEEKDTANLKTFSTMLRQLSRTVVKVRDGKQVTEFEALVPATSIINDVIFTLPLNQASAEFILALFNHMFGTSKETHVFVINWKKPQDGESSDPYLLPRELFTYLLLVHNYVKQIDPSRAFTIPYMFKTFGSKLQKENTVITDASIPAKILNQMPWAERFIIVKALGPAGFQFNSEIPACLFQLLRNECRKHYRPLQREADQNALLVADIFESLFELAILSIDHTKALLDDLMNPIFIRECSAEMLRASVTCLLVKQTKKPLTIENYRNLVQLIDLCLQRFDWPLDLVREYQGKETNLLYEVALKYEVLSLLGVASFVDIGNQVTIGTIQNGTNASTMPLITCFVTESNRIISNLVLRYVSDQTAPRTTDCATSPIILNALQHFCDNLMNLTKKLEATPVETPLLKGFEKRLNEFTKQIKNVSK